MLEWQARHVARHNRSPYLRLVTADDPAAVDDGEIVQDEPLGPETIASLVRLRRRLQAKLFSPDPGPDPHSPERED
jgi:hypothetical protein